MAKSKKKSITISKNTNNDLLKFSNIETNSLFQEFGSNNKGLSAAQAQDKLEKYGYNTLAKKKKYHWYNGIFELVLNPFNCILLIIAILNVVLPGQQNWPAFGIIIAMVLVSAGIKIFQEMRSNIASEKLSEMIETTAMIERNGIKSEIPIEDIVPGDIVHLAAGDMIPADLRILTAKDMFVSQSALTGESEPVEKLMINSSQSNSALEANNLCFMGTSVTTGSAKGIVISTGQNTLFGKIAKSLAKKRPKTNFDKGIKSVSWLLIITILIMTLAIFFIQALYTSRNMSNTNVWINAIIFSLAIAVGLIPEMLPMIVTLNLSKEAFKLSKQKTIVKNIQSIQSFGAMDVLCTDKTGTLTEDHILLERHINLEGKEDNRILLYGYLNSFYQTGLKNLIDVAIIEKAEKIHLHESINNYAKIDEIPFDFTRRRMSVILKNNQNNETLLVTKGALEEVVSVCTKAEYKGKLVTIDQKFKNKIFKNVSNLNAQGMRVIAIAINSKKLNPNKAFSTNDESEMTLIGWIALLDPPKLSAKDAVSALHARGVEVKVLTGDNDRVTKYVCQEVGIKSQRVLLGSDIEKMTDQELKEIVMSVDIFAKLSPEQKVRVVLAIKAKKHVVGFMGDGINDAGAMRAADIGISVDTAVDIAKESADIILLEKDLMILEKGVVEGRKSYANTIKYIKMIVSGNFGNMLSMLIASFWLPFQPMEATQVLLLNIICDVSQFAIPWDNVDEDFIKKPQTWNAKSILKFMLIMGPISTIFDMVIFAIMLYVFKWNDWSYASYFHTGWFITSLLTQIAIVIILRTDKIPIIKSRPSMPVVLSLILVLSIGMFFALVPNMQSLGFSTMVNYPMFFAYAALITLSYCFLTQIAKQGYIKIFKEWL